MTPLTPTQVAELRRKIEARYQVQRYEDADVFLVVGADGNPVNANDHDDYLDAETEMEAIIQDEVKAAMEAEEEEVS